MRRNLRFGPWALLLVPFAALSPGWAVDLEVASLGADLTLAERIACTEQVENAYWDHRIWPVQNPEPKPERAAVLSHEEIAAKVERSLLFEAALGQIFDESLEARSIQSELDRIARQTQDPDLLRDIFAALDYDPYRVAECFVRPRLVDRLVRERYAWDRNLHAALRERAEAERLESPSGEIADGEATGAIDIFWLGREDPGEGDFSEEGEIPVASRDWTALIGRLADRFIGRTLSPLGDPTGDPPEEALARQVGRGFSPLFEEADRFGAVAVLAVDGPRVQVASATWPKPTFEAWLREAEPLLQPVIPRRAEYRLPAINPGDPCLDDTWAPTSWGPPRPRSNHTAVWTGTEMIVWGGHDGTNVQSGGRYDPAADAWVPTSTVGAPAGRHNHTAIWTGSEMIVWGGWAGSPNYFASGGRYDPATDSWTPTSGSAAPTARERHTTVWTGSEMVVWGGSSGSALASGGRYDPIADSWSATSSLSAPSARFIHTAVWTGNEMIVWGGSSGASSLATGGRYDPVADSWTATATAGAPNARYDHVAVWSGSEMIVWAGWNGFDLYASGGRYDPATDAWQTLSTAGAPTPRLVPAAVWTGAAMVVWGGTDLAASLNTGGRYDPGTDSWTPTATAGAPPGRQNHVAVWSGTEMIVWGGWDRLTNHLLDGGARYLPSADTWTPTSRSGAPSPRWDHASVWTGTEMIVWGGSDFAGLGDGGRYDAASNSWTGMSLAGAPVGRWYPTAVWTGTEMIVWGGNDGGGGLNSGGRYAPVSDTWAATSLVDAPSERYKHSAVWTGNEMIVWGGRLGSSGYLGMGSRYDPSSDSWSGMATASSPSARGYHTAVWTGTEMIVWGGYSGIYLSSGGRYNPSTNGWSPTSNADAPSPRYTHAAVWTGDEMLVWGGYVSAGTTATGGRYDPATNSWGTTSSVSAPSQRGDAEAVWNGAQMIVFGGWNGTSALSSGGAYDPADDSWAAMSTSGAPSGRYAATSEWTGSEMVVWGGYDGARGIDSGGRYCASGVLGFDLGDAPDPTFPTLRASDGARHPLYGSLYLGASVDGEPDGLPSAWADGDDLDGVDDEDGVAWPGMLLAGQSEVIEVTASATGLLSAWIDFNGDGDWLDPGEQIFTDVGLNPGVNELQVAVPLEASAGTAYARFRLDSAGGLAPTGLGADGEVEDYRLTIVASADVELALVDSVDPVVEGASLVYSATVTNHGQLTATNVVLTNTLPAEVYFLGSTPGAPVCTESGGVVTCELGTLAAGASTEVAMLVEVPFGVTGPITDTAAVVCDQPDPTPENASASENTTVLDDPVTLFRDGFERGDTSAWSSTSGGASWRKPRRGGSKERRSVSGSGREHLQRQPAVAWLRRDTPGTSGSAHALAAVADVVGE